MEIERKFLIARDGSFRQYVTRAYRMAQGYMDVKGATVRVRLRAQLLPDGTEQNATAFLTIKGPSADGISRYEFEREIPLDDARQMLALCHGGLVEKVRHIVPFEGHTFEVDEFHGDNEGLLLAEVELGSVDEPFARPAFLREEVTGDKRYYNSNLLDNPYRNWKEQETSNLK